jgi:hypothetical protein
MSSVKHDELLKIKEMYATLWWDIRFRVVGVA